MELLSRILRTFSRLTLSNFRSAFIAQLVYSGITARANVLLGTANLIGLVLLLSGLLLGLFLPYSPLLRLGFILGGVFSYFIPYFLLFMLVYFKTEKRSKQVNDALPDVLHMIAANLRSGMTAYEAIRETCKHDFGPLAQELRKVTSKSQGVVSFADLLLEPTKTIKSDALFRSMTLFSSSLRSGGHVSELLEGLAQDIIDRQSLKRELVINTATNAMFIMFTIVVGTPVLLAISIYFVDVVGSIQSGTGTEIGQFGLGGLGGELAITSGFLTLMSFVILFITGLLATLFVGAMIDGDPKKGLKWAPILIGGSFAVFFVARILIRMFLGDPLA